MPQCAFKDGIRHGEGTITFANGDEYDGQWKDDKMHGEGTFTWTNGTVEHQGEWANGKPVRPDLS